MKKTIDEMDYGDVFVDGGGDVHVKIAIGNESNVLWVSGDSYFCKTYLHNIYPNHIKDWNKTEYEVVYNIHNLALNIQSLTNS